MSLRFAKVLCGTAVVTLALGWSVAAAEQTWSGEISDSHCGAKHPEGQAARACTESCVKGGASYVFVSGGKVYKLEDPSKLVAAHAGHMVSLTGEMKGETIAVAKIEMPKK
jgi:hypothetical protein